MENKISFVSTKSELDILISDYVSAIYCYYKFLHETRIIVDKREYAAYQLNIEDRYCRIFEFYKKYQDCIEFSSIFSLIKSEYDIMLETFVRRKKTGTL